MQNSHSIKLSGKFEIPEPIEIDRDYQISLTGSVDSIAKHSDGGEISYVYSLKPLYGEVTTDKGDTVKMVKKGSQSQKLRAEILSLGLNYEQEMNIIISNLDDILERYK
jgi:hypothetical protein